MEENNRLLEEISKRISSGSNLEAKPTYNQVTPTEITDLNNPEQLEQLVSRLNKNK